MLADLPPLLLRPHYVPKPWGGRRLAQELARSDLPPGAIGESWEIFDLGEDDAEARCSRIDGGRFDGQPLRDVLGHPFPLLLKVIDAREHLSIQLHPDEASGGEVKEEAWIALADGGEVAVAAAGSELGDGAAAGAWLARLERVPLAAGDSAGGRPPTMVPIAPGTVHAILAGSLLFEVQNPADVTWRLDDHGRVDEDGAARPLHLEQASEVLTRPTPPAFPLGEEGRSLVTGHFRVELHPPGRVDAPRTQAVFFTRPGTVLHGGAGSFEVPAGRTVWIPPTTTALRSDGWMIASAAL